MCVEVSLDNSVLFVGGSTEFNFEQGSAILQAVTFNKKLSYICDLKIDDQDNRFVSRIKRVEETNRFFAATLDHIYVFEFKNRKFCKLSAILNVHKGHQSISDMVISQNSLYTIAVGDNEITKIEFATY